MAYAAPLALVVARVASLEAAPADLKRDDGESAFVPAGLGPTGDQVNAFIKIAGKVKPDIPSSSSSGPRTSSTRSCPPAGARFSSRAVSLPAPRAQLTAGMSTPHNF